MKLYFYTKYLSFMRRFFILVLPLFCFLGCNNKPRIGIETLRIGNSQCSQCAQIAFTIPKATQNTQLASSINQKITTLIMSLLHYDDETLVTDVPTAMDSFNAEYAKMKEKFPEELSPWEALIDGSITYEDRHIISIKIDAYIFTGGAHGHSTSQFLTFAKETATEVDINSFFKDPKAFYDLAEQKFRAQEKISAAAPINDTGFMFENEVFALPSTMGYTQTGFQLLYQPYEISSYADGTIILTVPYKDANPFLKFPSTP